MKFRIGSVSALILTGLLLAAIPGSAHHAVLAKFDDKKPMKLVGIVTLVDWKNPHVHVFMNVKDAKGVLNWAAELESPIELQQNGWNKDSLKPGDSITVTGMGARNGSRQVWAESIVTAGGKQVFNVSPMKPPASAAARPTPRWPDKQPRLGPAVGGGQGYWAHPSSTAMMEAGVKVAMNRDGLLQNVADAGKVAPMQPWALAVYQNRQRRFLQDDPTFINCKPPGGSPPVSAAPGGSVRRGPRSAAHFRADWRGQQQLPHHVPGRQGPRRAGWRRRR